jgi:hypothetical protein
MFVFAVERPEVEYAKAFYGNIGRYLYQPDSVQRYDDPDPDVRYMARRTIQDMGFKP